MADKYISLITPLGSSTTYKLKAYSLNGVSAYSGATAANWVKFATWSGSCASGNDDTSLLLNISYGYYSVNNYAKGILFVNFRGSEESTTPGRKYLRWMVGSGIDPDKWVLTHTITNDYKITLNLYVNLDTAWLNYSIVKINEHSWGTTENKWELLNRVEGITAIPTNEIQLTSSLDTISNNATTATALLSNAGGLRNPIYFSNGKPAAGSITFDTLIANRLMWTVETDKPKATNHYVDSSHISIADTTLHSDYSLYVNGATGVMGNIKAFHSNTTDSTIAVENSNGTVDLRVSTDRGLYDNTAGDWLIYTEKSSGNTFIKNWASIGSGVIPISINNLGRPVPSTSTVGNNEKPVYLNAGTITAGLPVWTLTNPTLFVENESFNDKTIIGNYYISANTIATTIPDDGKPGTGTIYGTLKVSKMFTGTTNAKYLRQDWFAHSSAKHFIRRTNDDEEWSGWSAYAYIPPDTTTLKPAAIGSTKLPIYAKATGELAPIAYTIESSVPANAKFTDTNTHYTSKNIIGASATATANAAVTASTNSIFLNHLEESTVKSSNNIVGTGLTTVASDANGKITINSSYTPPTATASVNGIGRVVAGTGIGVSYSSGAATISNSGVRSIATGTSNGTISVNTGGTSANVAVKGLGTAAYTASTEYLAAGIGSYVSSEAGTAYYIKTSYTTTSDRCYISGIVEGMNGRGNRLASVRFAVEWSGSAFVHGAYWDLNGLLESISFNTDADGLVYIKAVYKLQYPETRWFAYLNNNGGSTNLIVPSPSTTSPGTLSNTYALTRIYATLADSGVTATNYGPSTNASPSHGGTFSVPYITVDAKGRITAASTKTITLPADPTGGKHIFPIYYSDLDFTSTNPKPGVYRMQTTHPVTGVAEYGGVISMTETSKDSSNGYDALLLISSASGSNKHHVYVRRLTSTPTWLTWTKVLTEHDVAAKTTSLTFGSTSTIATINGNDIKVTMPSNPNSDTKVTQSNTMAATYRKVLLSSQTAAAGTASTSDTDLVYKTPLLEYLPIEGRLVATGVSNKNMEYNAKRGDYTISMGFSKSNKYHGLYSWQKNSPDGDWMIYSDENGNVRVKGNADTATALTSNAGGLRNPIYFSGGKPVAGAITFDTLIANRLMWTVETDKPKATNHYVDSSHISIADTTLHSDYSLYVNGAIGVKGNIIPITNNSYNLGTTDTLRWKSGFFTTSLRVGAINTTVFDVDKTKNVYVGPDGFYTNGYNSADTGFFVRGLGTLYARLFINTIGSTETPGITILQLGNSTDSSEAKNSNGTLQLYSNTTKYTSIKSSLEIEASHLNYLPIYGSTSSKTYYGRLVGIYKGTTSGSNGFSDVGSTSLPVYVTANGVVKAITTLGTAYGGTGNTSFTGSRLVYSLTDTKLATGSIVSNGKYISNVTYLSINQDHSTGYNLNVNGTSCFNDINVNGTSYLNSTAYFTTLTTSSSNDAYGLFTNKDNFCSIGTETKYWYRLYSNWVYATTVMPRPDYSCSIGLEGNKWTNIYGVNIHGDKVYGAVWNDYAEFRKAKNQIKISAGKVVKEDGNDCLIITEQRLERGCNIISDTFGFAIGETDDAKLPIAVSGRVLAYPYESREEFRKHIGWPVCSGPNGTVSIMTEEEEMRYPSRIIGTISAVPDYEIWHGGTDVIVDGRIWIKVR